MKNILILAEGLAAEHFIKKINEKRAGANNYIVVAPSSFPRPEKTVVDMKFHSFDPTSHSKLRELLNRIAFNIIFVVLNSEDETKETLRNIRVVDDKIRVYLLDNWDAFDMQDDESYTQIFNLNQLIGNRLFVNLPNVPRIAQNIGLFEGEIMEVMVPFGSSFAYRHLGSISQVKWKIMALYRDGKLILPTAATMIRPQDTMLTIGKPNVLNNIYQRISNKGGLFPEPFGKNLYVILDMKTDSAHMLNYIYESMYLKERLEGRELVIRVINPGDFNLLNKIKTLKSKTIHIVIDYSEDSVGSIIISDMQKFNIGFIFTSIETFSDKSLASELLDLKKLVYIYGDTPLHTVDTSVILMTEEAEMESISSTSFYISETLDYELLLCNFDPEGDFGSREMIKEHYETISLATNYPITIEEKRANPMRMPNIMDNILQIAPFTKGIESGSILSIFSTKVSDHLLNGTKHPKLLVPVVLD